LHAFKLSYTSNPNQKTMSSVGSMGKMFGEYVRPHLRRKKREEYERDEDGKEDKTKYFFIRLRRISYPKDEDLVKVSANYQVHVEWDDRSVTNEPLDRLYQDGARKELRYLILDTLSREERARLHAKLLAGPFKKDKEIAELFRAEDRGEAVQLHNEIDRDEDSVEETPKASCKLPVGRFDVREIPHPVKFTAPFGFEVANVVRFDRRAQIYVVERALVPRMLRDDMYRPDYYAVDEEGHCTGRAMTASDMPWTAEWTPSKRAMEVKHLAQGNDNHKFLGEKLKAMGINFVAFPKYDEESRLDVVGGDWVFRIDTELYYELLTEAPVKDKLVEMGFTASQVAVLNVFEDYFWLHKQFPTPKRQRQAGGGASSARNGASSAGEEEECPTSPGGAWANLRESADAKRRAREKKQKVHHLVHYSPRLSISFNTPARVRRGEEMEAFQAADARFDANKALLRAFNAHPSPSECVLRCWGKIEEENKQLAIQLHNGDL
jgi:hypothetical protein